MWKLQPANIYAADEIPISWGAPCPTGNAPAAAVSGESDVKKTGDNVSVFLTMTNITHVETLNQTLNTQMFFS